MSPARTTFMLLKLACGEKFMRSEMIHLPRPCADPIRRTRHRIVGDVRMIQAAPWTRFVENGRPLLADRASNARRFASGLRLKVSTPQAGFSVVAAELVEQSRRRRADLKDAGGVALPLGSTRSTSRRRVRSRRSRIAASAVATDDYRRLPQSASARGHGEFWKRSRPCAARPHPSTLAQAPAIGRSSGVAAVAVINAAAAAMLWARSSGIWSGGTGRAKR